MNLLCFLGFHKSSNYFSPEKIEYFSKDFYWYGGGSLLPIKSIVQKRKCLRCNKELEPSILSTNKK